MIRFAFLPVVIATAIFALAAGPALAQNSTASDAKKTAKHSKDKDKSEKDKADKEAKAKAEAEARAFAEQMRPIFAELEALTATQAAATLNERGVPTAAGRKWRGSQVLRVRRRLAQPGRALRGGRP